MTLNTANGAASNGAAPFFAMFIFVLFVVLTGSFELHR